MTAVNSATFAQQEVLSVSRSVEFNYERSSKALQLSASLENQSSVSSNNFQRVFDVVEISDEAQARLLQNHRDAEALAEYVQNGHGPELRVLPPNPGRITVEFAALQESESFSFTETYELSFLRETSLEIETDEGSVEVTQSSLVEVSLSATFEFSRSTSSFSGSITA